MTAGLLTPPQFREKVIRPDGRVECRLELHPGQVKVWDSLRRFVFMLASTQGGKTCFGPHWLHREITDPVIGRGPGDYLAITSTFKLLELKMLPEFLKVFQDIYGLGVFRDAKKVFEFYYQPNGLDRFNTEQIPTRVIFGSAQNPESIESATAKAAWLDEVGQDQFPLSSWQAVLRRLSLAQGRVLGTTTLYNLGWLKQQVYDPWLKGDPDIDIIQFNSLMNPVFPRDEYERAKRTLPRWLFNLFYEGLYSRPAGVIYDNYDDVACTINRVWEKPPQRFQCYVAHDFGPNNTSAVWYAQDPETGLFYVYRDYLEGGKSSFEHAEEWKKLSEGENIVRRVGGNLSEGATREAFTAAGWPIQAPHPKMRDVEEGIKRVYAWHSGNRIMVFRDVHGYLDEKMSYRRKLDDNYRPTTEISDKADYHRMDAERYLFSIFAPEMVQDMEQTHTYNLAPVNGHVNLHVRN